MLSNEQSGVDNANSHFTGALLPKAALLSNGSYSVFLTRAGAGYASWSGLDVNRWREDGIRDCWGQFYYVRDLENDDVWSVGKQPVPRQDCTYEHSFLDNLAEFRCHAQDIDIQTSVCVAADCDAEIRLLRITNPGSETRRLELTSYSEVCLNNRRADRAHPAFAKLFVETEFDTETGALFARRRPRSADERPVWAVHVSASSEEEHDAVEYATDRYSFIGRGRSAANPRAMERNARLSAVTGPVLDPIFALRRTLVIRPGATARIAFVTGAAGTEATAQFIARCFCQIEAADKTFADAAARTGGQSSPSKGSQEVSLFYQLADGILHARPELRDGTALIGEQPDRRELWAHGISGDRPIVLVQIDLPDGEALVKEAIDAHVFLSDRGLPFDIVFLGDHSAVEALLAEHKRAETSDKPSGFYALAADAVSEQSRNSLIAAARVLLRCSRGSLAEQLRSTFENTTSGKSPLPTPPKSTDADPALATEGLLYWNGFGGFKSDGSYVITTGSGTSTPAPWCNVIANPAFGCLTSESGLGFTWAGNSQLNRLTPWSNDPISDPPGEVVYLRDEETGRFWTPTPMPLGHSSARTIHAQGYTRYESTDGSLNQELTVHVPIADPVKIIHLVVRNDGSDTRSVTTTYFLEWVLGTIADDAAMRVVCEFDSGSQSVVARNVWQSEFAGKIAFAAASLPLRSFTCDRSEFLGPYGSTAHPAGLASPDLGGNTGPLIDPCAALMVDLKIAPGESAEVVFVLGQTDNRDAIGNLLKLYVTPELARQSLAAVSHDWDRTLGTITVKTPDTAFDLMMNRWLLYQVIACRVWARSAFYQSGGAYGFRDQLQDVMALVHCAPEEARAHILRAAARQFDEGDVQHWWHPPSGVGVRTRMTDDLYFLPYVVHHYVSTTGDRSVLDEQVAFISSPVLKSGQEESFEVPDTSQDTATIYDHCCRALEHGLRLGSHGLPLMGTGDWNDGMNKVGAEGKGESVWNGWFFLTVLKSFASLAFARNDEIRAGWCDKRAEALRQALEANAWDGGWYRRAYFDDGTPLGSHLNDECQIDAIPQAWAVISGVADGERTSMAMQAVSDRLVRDDDRLIQLFDPPFDKGVLQPGYIKGYVPGIRENGGQYTHAATWVALATALQGDGDRAFALWNFLNPVTHAQTKDGAEHYMVEPYVVSADIYGAHPHTGRGGWTWYTGSAAWLYRVGLEGILGIRRHGHSLSIAPCIPQEWPGFEANLRYGTSTYRIHVERTPGSTDAANSILLDGRPVHQAEIPLTDDGDIHAIHVIIGAP